MSDMDKPKRKRKYPVVYRPSLVERSILFIPLATMALSVAGILMLYIFYFDELYQSGFILCAILPTLFVLYSLFIFVWSTAERIFHDALIIETDGIWYHNYGKRFYSWDMLVELSDETGITVEKSKIYERNPIAKWLVGSHSWHENFLPLADIIDTGDSLRETEFGQILYEDAPHLFEDVEKPEKRKQSDSDLTPYMIDEQNEQTSRDAKASRKRAGD